MPPGGTPAKCCAQTSIACFRNGGNTCRPRAGSIRNTALQEDLARIAGDLVITQGFIVSNKAGETVLLGRGGSDTSASCLGAVLGAERIEIWTDVPGMFTANPHDIPSARLLRQLDYAEAQELATMGAKVLHPRSIEPAQRQRIPLHIKCTSVPDLPGTVISDDTSDFGGANQSDRHKDRRHVDFYGIAGHVAGGRLPRRCVRHF